MADKTDGQREADLKAARKKTKPDSVLSLSDCAALWGVTKPRFVTKRAEMTNFPEPVEVRGNAHFYNARACIDAMLKYLQRYQDAAKSKAARAHEILGDVSPAAGLREGFTLQDLTRLSALQAELIDRAIQRGELVRAADVQRRFAWVFADMSECLSNLANEIDPHGKLAPSVRELVDSLGAKRLIAMHREFKKELTGDAGATGNRRKAG